MKYVTRSLVSVIAVSKSQEFFYRKLVDFLYFFSTTTQGIRLDDKSMFSRRRHTLGGVSPP